MHLTKQMLYLILSFSTQGKKNKGMNMPLSSFGYN